MKLVMWMQEWKQKHEYILEKAGFLTGTVCKFGLNLLISSGCIAAILLVFILLSL